MKENLELISVKRIAISKNNPRRINEKSKGFEKLVDSVKAQGVIVPVHVRNIKSGKFLDKKEILFPELLAGERRLRAAKKAGLQEIRAINHGLITDEEAFEITFAENFARQDLTPIEEGSAVGILLEKYKGDYKAVSAKLGKSEKWVRVRNCIYNNLSADWDIELAENEELSYLTAAHLGLVARFPVPMQKGILSRVKKHWGKYTVSELDKDLTEMLRLISKAPFDTKQCFKCNKRSGVQPTLWADKKKDVSGKNDRCLDLRCWDKKEADQAKNKYLELKEKYSGLICVRTSWCSSGHEDQKLKRAYGKVLSPNQYIKSKKIVEGSVPALVVPSTGKGKVIYVELTQKAAQKEANKPKTLKQLRAELKQKRWGEIVDRLIKIIEEIEPENMLTERAMLVISLFIVIGGCEKRIYRTAEQQKFLNKAMKLLNEGKTKNAAVLVFKELWEAVRGEIKWKIDSSGDKDSIKEARIIASMFDVDLNEIYEAVCNEPGFEEPAAWKNLKADGTPKKTKTDKVTKKKTKT
jgi:ParB family chromosome partitioning protein